MFNRPVCVSQPYPWNNFDASENCCLTRASRKISHRLIPTLTQLKEGFKIQIVTSDLPGDGLPRHVDCIDCSDEHSIPVSGRSNDLFRNNSSTNL